MVAFVNLLWINKHWMGLVKPGSRYVCWLDHRLLLSLQTCFSIDTACFQFGGNVATAAVISDIIVAPF